MNNRECINYFLFRIMDEYAHFIIGPNDKYDPESKVIEKTGVALKVCLLHECVYLFVCTHWCCFSMTKMTTFSYSYSLSQF